GRSRRLREVSVRPGVVERRVDHDPQTVDVDHGRRPAKDRGRAILPPCIDHGWIVAAFPHRPWAIVPTAPLSRTPSPRRALLRTDGLLRYRNGRALTAMTRQSHAFADRTYAPPQ